MLTNNKRLLSLDVFRGLAIVGMIMADFPGSWSAMFPIFQHATWDGCTQTDLVFPFFLFIVGISITISLSKPTIVPLGKSAIIKKIVKRSVGIFIIGVILNIWPFFSYFGSFSVVDFSSFRLLGVLQRIALIYFCSSLIFLYFKPKQIVYVSIAILLGYWASMTLIPIPGFGTPDISIRPDGNTPNLAAWIDSVVLGSFVWEYSKPWDPEGIFSTIPGIVTSLIGVLTGFWLKKEKDQTTKTVWMFVAGCLLLLVGYFWDFLFAINKSIWTSSFVIFTGGWALVFYACLYWLIDVQNYTQYLTPLKVYGKNALGVFAISWLIERILYNVGVNFGGEIISLKDFIFSTLYASWLTPIVASMFYSVTVVAFGMFLMYRLDKKGIILKL